MHRSLLRAFAIVSCLSVSTATGCNGENGNDAGDAGADITADVADAFVLVDSASDVMDADTGIDVPVDVQPASLPGRWRLVGFESTSAGGSTLSLTDTDTNVTYAGSSTYARANGLLTLAPNRATSSVAVLVGGHVLTFPGAGSASDAMAVFGNVLAGSLGSASFTPLAGTPLSFHTNADGTITDTAVVGSFGNVALTWTRADVLPALAGISSQVYAVRLQPDTATPLQHPRAAIAWDRPGTGTGYTVVGDAPLVFIGSTQAAYTVTVTYVQPDYTATFDGTTFSLGYVIVYDDVNGNGVYDAGNVSSSADGGVVTDGDPLRGVSRVVVTVRSLTAPSASFLASPFADAPPGVQLGVLRDDPAAAAGTSLGAFDSTHAVTPDTVIEAGGTRLPDVL